MKTIPESRVLGYRLKLGGGHDQGSQSESLFRQVLACYFRSGVDPAGWDRLPRREEDGARGLKRILVFKF
ncbi:hypothetical protein M0R45_024484 [Rubus argutus]|uniref:Uncharacterized protein n=1 Tax=Rubus argutus TaxID=59490 RepID=A0AAW1WRP2_RUBAR